MTVLEKGKFIKNFVRLNTNNKLIKVPHSNYRGYSTKDIELIEPLIDSIYWENWEHYLHDLKSNEDWKNNYSDWAHFLYALNSIPEEDIKKYDLPTDYIVIDKVPTD